MYKDDGVALENMAKHLQQERERLSAENEQMRLALRQQGAVVPVRSSEIYRLQLSQIPVAERARLAAHKLTAFPVWAVAVLNIVTIGLFPLIHFGLMHDKMPKAADNDPSGGKAIGFSFIPYFNMYWVFFNTLRLSDRLDLQFKLRGLRKRSPRGLLLACCIVSVIPYINIFIGIPIMWTIGACFLQSTVNKVSRLSPSDWQAARSIPDVSGRHAQDNTPSFPALAASSSQYADAQAPYNPFVRTKTPEELETEAKAAKLVRWSHILGWGGLVMLFVGTSLGAALAGGTGAIAIGSASMVSMVTGAIIGQIGRGMQGRVI